MGLLAQLSLLIVAISASQYTVSKSGNVQALAESKSVYPSKQYADLMQLSNDHSGDDNEGFQDIKKMLVTFLLSALVCLVVVLLIQWVLCLSKRYRYDLVRLRKNYENLQRTSQLPASEPGNA
jgi:hypothetical protein